MSRFARTGLGRPFHTLWAATTVSNLGDGIVAAAAPLLLASATDDPVLIGLAVFAQQLPWLLFSLVSGALVDRVDRRRLIVTVHLIRGVVVGGLALAVWSGQASIPVIYATGFLLGVCETLGDNASATLIPAVVRDTDLPRANARMQAAFVVANRLAGRPLGAALFVAAAALPFGVNAATFVAAAVLIATLRKVPRAEPPPERRDLRGEIVEGVRWLWHEPVVRMIALALLLMNITLLAGFSVLVLYARDQLGLDAYGYGLLLTATAVGGLLGAVCAPRLQARFSGATLLRAGLVIETLTHVGLALAGTVWLAGPVLVAFGVHSAVFNAVELTRRQRAVPEALRGRVQSVFMTFAVGGNALGALVGGPIAARFGIAGPFWFSAAAMAVLTCVAWRPFGRNLTRASTRAAAAAAESATSPRTG
ncbi:MFS transporter [Streptomyces sp. NPDC002851]